MIDRELYLPRRGPTTPTGCAEAGVPADIEFAHQTRAGHRHAHPRAGRRRAGAVGGRGRGLRRRPDLRAELEARRVGYVLAIGCDRRIPTAAGPLRADELAAGLPRRAWQRLSAGAGSEGAALLRLGAGSTTPTPPSPPTRRHPVLVAAGPPPPRHRRAGVLPLLRPDAVPLRELVRVAGRRWTVEESFQAGKGLAGLDEHQVRRWTSWRRWTLLAMVAHALLAVIAAHEHTDRPAPAGLIALTCNEIRRLFIDLRHRARPSPRLPAGLVALAATPPAPRPHQPLPAPGGRPTWT